MGKAWWICRLAAGIISIILAAAVFILEVYVCIIDSFSMTGPDIDVSSALDCCPNKAAILEDIKRQKDEFSAG